jgi:hypothetical protein
MSQHRPHKSNIVGMSFGDSRSAVGHSRVTLAYRTSPHEIMVRVLNGVLFDIASMEYKRVIWLVYDVYADYFSRRKHSMQPHRRTTRPAE